MVDVASRLDKTVFLAIRSNTSNNEIKQKLNQQTQDATRIKNCEEIIAGDTGANLKDLFRSCELVCVCYQSITGISSKTHLFIKVHKRLAVVTILKTR